MDFQIGIILVFYIGSEFDINVALKNKNVEAFTDRGNVNTLKHFILLVVTLRSVTLNSGSNNHRVLATINIHATRSQC